MFVSLIIFFSGSLRSLASLPQRRGFLSATVTPLTGLSGLLHHCNTRYDWLVRPYSAGSFTLQETPSFAWRTNVGVSCRGELARNAASKNANRCLIPIFCPAYPRSITRGVRFRPTVEKSLLFKLW